MPELTLEEIKNIINKRPRDFSCYSKDLATINDKAEQKAREIFNGLHPILMKKAKSLKKYLDSKVKFK